VHESHLPERGERGETSADTKEVICCVLIPDEKEGIFMASVENIYNVEFILFLSIETAQFTQNLLSINILFGVDRRFARRVGDR